MPTVQVFEWPSASESPSADANADFVRDAFANGLRWLKSRRAGHERAEPAQPSASFTAQAKNGQLRLDMNIPIREYTETRML